MKTCSKCGAVKPASEFYKDRAKPDGLRSECKQCSSARQRARLQQDPEKRRAANLHAHIARERAYKTAHREEIREHERTRRRANWSEYLQQTRRWRAAHAEKHRAAAQAWRLAHPEAVRNFWRVSYHNRRARKRAACGAFTVQQWRDLKAAYGYTCLCCGRQEPEIKLTPDHVIPLARGGSNDIGNIQPLCLACNMQKHTDVTDYRPNWQGPRMVQLRKLESEAQP